MVLLMHDVYEPMEVCVEDTEIIHWLLDNGYYFPSIIPGGAGEAEEKEKAGKKKKEGEEIEEPKEEEEEEEQIKLEDIDK